MNILAEYKGLKVSVVRKRKGQTCKDMPSIHYVFKLTYINNIESYIEAAAFGVFNNAYPPKKSSIMDFSDENKMVYWSNDDVDIFLKNRRAKFSILFWLKKVFNYR